MQTAPLIPADMRAFLETTARAVLATCSVKPGAPCGRAASGPDSCGAGTNTLGFRAITPGGYPAVWIQDFTMNFSSGLLDREVGLNHRFHLYDRPSADGFAAADDCSGAGKGQRD